jgi:hypothetical protein
MSVRGGFIGEFCAAIIAFVFPHSAASAAATNPAESRVVIVVVVCHH